MDSHHKQCFLLSVQNRSTSLDLLDLCGGSENTNPRRKEMKKRLSQTTKIELNEKLGLCPAVVNKTQLQNSISERESMIEYESVTLKIVKNEEKKHKSKTTPEQTFQSRPLQSALPTLHTSSTTKFDNISTSLTKTGGSTVCTLL